jgi:hypothetical protein
VQFEAAEGAIGLDLFSRMLHNPVTHSIVIPDFKNLYREK